MKQRINYERSVHHDCLPDEDTEEDHVNMDPKEHF